VGQARDKESLLADARAASQGDRAAFDRLHDRLGPWLKRMLGERVARAGQPSGGAGGMRLDARAFSDVAEDLSQQVWAALWRSMREGKYDPERSSITTFSYAVAHHVWLQHAKRTRRGPLPALGGVGESGSRRDDPAEYSDPAEEAALAEQLETVRGLLRGDHAAVGEGGDAKSGLTSDERGILVGVSRGESDRELALRLGVAPSTAHVRKKSAMEKLRALLTSRAERARLDDESPSRAASGRRLPTGEVPHA
jgi:DNA-directed RNA polymerase specialized sigma24 family protein